MTREEAVTILKAFMENPLFSEVHKAAFNIAIHDIKAYQDWNINNLILVNKDNYEPTTKNDLGVDYISRADVNRIICEYRDDATETGNERDLERAYGANAVGELISELPSVTPQEPKTGHWNNIPKYKDIAWRCSECEHFTTMKHNYCPNCGARMVEP